MGNETLIFALVACACYAMAFLTSHLLIHWVLPGHMKSRLGSEVRFVAIDGIRGYLAFGVYVHHCLMTWLFLRAGHWAFAPHAFENELGQGAVAVFFMITAFLFWGRAQAKRGIEVKAFFVNRLFRIYPLYTFVVFLICIGVAFKSHWTAHQPVSAMIATVVKWMFFRDPNINMFTGTTLIIAGVNWTLLYEAWFYLSLPLFVVAILQKHALWIRILALAVVAVLFKLNHIEFAIASAFLGGVVAVYWKLDPTRVKLAQSKLAAGVAIICIACVILIFYAPFNAVALLLLTVFFLVISSGNTLFGALKTPAALWLGEISYSIYLCHGFILWVVAQNILPRFSFFHPTTFSLAVTAVCLTPVVILACTGTYLMIERPLIAKGHAISKRLLQRNAA
jgi:peptidoglycan/LPS O-acetylase OafA/YrhL